MFMEYLTQEAEIFLDFFLEQESSISAIGFKQLACSLS